LVVTAVARSGTAKFITTAGLRTQKCGADIQANGELFKLVEQAKAPSPNAVVVPNGVFA